MSKTNDLRIKYEKSIGKVEKAKKTIERHKNQLNKKINALNEAGYNTDDLNAIKWNADGKGSEVYWEVCEVEGKIRDIKGAERKLKDAERIMNNWKEKLNKELDKDDFINNAPEVIVEFLNKWKEMAFDWHVKKLEKYRVFRKKLKEEARKAEKDLGVKENRVPNKEQKAELKKMGLDYNSVRNTLNAYAGAVVLNMDTFRDEKERLEWLDKTLENEKRAKLIDLVNRIKEVAGDIEDASKLSVSRAGNLNGIINGSKADAKVETIGAGGYNIQCFHYRTLVHEIKGE